MDIEYDLAANKYIEDPILVLCDAYRISLREETRRSIVRAVRQTFASQIIPDDDDSLFIDQAAKWYKSHHGKLTLNLDYFTNYEEALGAGAIESKDIYSANPLYFQK